MQVKQLIELLKRFDPEAQVHLSLSLPGRVISTHENLWVADYGGGPQLNAALDFRQFHVYAGCGMEQLVTNVPPHPFDPSHHDAEQREPEVDLGEYESQELALRVRDFYNYHRRPGEPLQDPDFDYEHWIPPRTVSGEYNPRIAEILKEKLLQE